MDLLSAREMKKPLKDTIDWVCALVLLLIWAKRLSLLGAEEDSSKKNRRWFWEKHIIATHYYFIIIIALVTVDLKGCGATVVMWR